jgi:flagellar biosynthesis protein
LADDTSSKIASAIKYDKDRSMAPKVVAKGLGLVAENIIAKGEESDVPVYRDETLAKQLYNLSLGEEIPAELYSAVAEVLVFISKIDISSRKK